MRPPRAPCAILRPHDLDTVSTFHGNNVAERECIKPIVIGRKNYLFCGSVSGAEAAELYYTLILSAIANELDPERYLATVFIRSRLLPKERWEELLPWRIASLEEKPEYHKR